MVGKGAWRVSKFFDWGGFSRNRLYGIGPINVYGWSASVFYRRVNCFNL